MVSNPSCVEHLDMYRFQGKPNFEFCKQWASWTHTSCHTLSKALQPVWILCVKMSNVKIVIWMKFYKMMTHSVCLMKAMHFFSFCSVQRWDLCVRDFLFFRGFITNRERQRVVNRDTAGEHHWDSLGHQLAE